MALTVRELLEQTRGKYHLNLLAGKDDLDYTVTWVHMMEDTSAAEFFWGNELVVTSGYAAHTAGELCAFADVMASKNCAGIVINVGKYLQRVPEQVVRHCQSLGLPLLTMPWEMSITEFVRECCALIHKSRKGDDELANAVIQVIRSPQESAQAQSQLSDVFDQQRGFVVLAAYTQMTEASRGVTDHRSTLRLHTALRMFACPFLVFRYQHRFVILLNQTEEEPTRQAAQRILETIQEKMPEMPVYIGIGEPVHRLERLSESYHGAVAASRRGELQGQALVRFRDMGFYRLLYSVPDEGLLRSYYQEVMGPLLEQDYRSGSAYTETLFRYLLSDGSLQAVAAAMYTHRNTVNYRMGKIRALLGKQLDTQAERLPYLLAYHAGVVLRLVEDLEGQKKTFKKTEKNP